MLLQLAISYPRRRILPQSPRTLPQLMHVTHARPSSLSCPLVFAGYLNQVHIRTGLFVSRLRHEHRIDHRVPFRRIMRCANLANIILFVLNMQASIFSSHITAFCDLLDPFPQYFRTLNSVFPPLPQSFPIWSTTFLSITCS
jgi:hypothetical protein